MYPVSDAFLRKINENTRKYYWSGTITTKYGRTYSFENKDIVKGSAYVNHKCCGNSEIEIGSAYAGEMRITLFNSIDRYTLTDAEVTLSFHLILDDGKEETVPMGVYVVSEANRNIKTLELIAYDRMIKLDKDFKDTTTVGKPYEILTLLAETCKVELAQTQKQIESLTNGKEVFSIYEDNDIETWRDVLYYLAQALCCFAVFNRQGKLELRQYSMQPVFEINNTHRFDSSFSDFKTKYTAISSTNIRTQTAEYYALEVDDGLTMNLETNPMLQYGLKATRERILKNILAKISEIIYVPFDSNTIGNPALDVGDVIRQKGGHADETSYYCVTEFECRVNGKERIKGVGKNPRLAGAKSKNDKNITGLLNQAEASRIVYYNFINAVDYKIGDKQTEIISINYVSIEETTAMFLAQIILEVTPETDGGTSVLKVTYKKGLEEETTFYPMETYHQGRHTLALFYPLTGVEENQSNQFNVFLSMEGGTATIDAGNVRATISGQGLAAGLAEWDGKINITDTFEEPVIWEVSNSFSIEKFYENLSVKQKGPSKPQIADVFKSVEFGNLVFEVVALDEHLGAMTIVKSFSVDVIYPPTYDSRYVEVLEDGFSLITGYQVETSTEATINYGRMSVLSIDTEQFESIGSMEVMKC